MSIEPAKLEPLKRAVVLGTSCSGKTTFAQRLARLTGARHVELDTTNWLPNWTPRPNGEFRMQPRCVTANGGRYAFVVENRTSKVRRLFKKVPFDLQPNLRGDLLELRPLRAEDFSALYSVAADPLIWEQHPARDRYKEEVFREFFREALESGGALVATDTADGRVIGSSRFHGYDEARGEIEIGWTFLARCHWGGVYNGEMKRLMLRHAFRFVRSVIFLVGTGNLRSQRAVEKLGAVRVGQSDRGGRDSFVYRITASTFFDS